MISEEFAEALRDARRRKRLSMIAVAELTGIAVPIYKMIESGKIYPDLKRLDFLCTALEFSCPGDSADGC